MKITINNLNGVARVEFFKGGKVVHAEFFSGKTSNPYTRDMGRQPEFDRHHVAFVMGVLGDPEFTYSVHL